MDPNAEIDLPEHIPVLDGLRGLAIILVMVAHLAPRGDSATAFPLLYALTSWGWVGVELFFVLSGFLITRILLRTRQDAHYYRNFYVRRALRIFPAYYLSIPILLYGFLPLISPDNVSRLSSMQGWFWLYGTNLIYPFTGVTALGLFTHFWSLSVEEHFYWIWPAVVRRFRPAWVCMAVVLGSPILRGVLAWLGVTVGTLYVFTLCRLDAMMMGAGVSALLASKVPLGRLRRAAWKSLVVLVPALAALMYLTGGLSPYNVPTATIGLSILDAIATCVLVLVISAGSSSPVARAFSSRPLTLFGKYSYAMYIYHLPVFHCCVRFSVMGAIATRFNSIDAGVVGLWLTEFGATFGIAWVSWQLVEQPFLRLKARFTG